MSLSHIIKVALAGELTFMLKPEGAGHVNSLCK